MGLPLLKICTTLALSLSTWVYADHIGSSYGAPSHNGGGGSSYGAPSFGGGGGSSYGAPSFGGGGGGAITSAYSIPSSAYGAPSAGYSGGGGGGGYGDGDHGRHEQYEHPKPYEFGYSVKDPHTGSDFKQQETSDGHTVRGQYKVHLPDGRVQIVTYTADWKTGFHADVKYEGEAVYPSTYGHSGGGGGYGGGSSTYGVPSTSFSHGGGGDYGGSGVSTAVGTSYNNLGGGGHGGGGGGYSSSSGGGGYPSAGYHQSESSYSVPGY
ncbi:pro-resilin [Nilaparvata lugens]|uniref:Cuticular protein n=1 Tax=Nilaparvata lugens TaxID=108931 RepID=A0A2S1ZSE6_NILLU|nr:pro-resilin [Nilaparvata lugens]AWK28377.1 cuticular protein [Nilaparvata lugens]